MKMGKGLEPQEATSSYLPRKRDGFPVFRFHHVEFWSSDATTLSRRFSSALGIPLVALSDLSTGNCAHASYLLSTHDLHLLFTASYSASISTSQSSSPSIQSFSSTTFQRFVASHGIGLRAIAVEVDDAAVAFQISIFNGAKPSHPPFFLGSHCEAAMAEVFLYGDVVLRYISFHNFICGEFCFLPGFKLVGSESVNFGLYGIDHVVGNVPNMADTVAYIKQFTGFHEFAEFIAGEVGTAESGLNSIVLANDEETVFLPINEPVSGKRRSQIQTYLEHNEGAGVQHLGIGTDDIFRTLRLMRGVSGGFEFMPAPPYSYYESLRSRAKDVLTKQQIEECEELGILMDGDDHGVLLQIFTKPIGDRPTIFLEIIQRIRCMSVDGTGTAIQRGGCGGFGKGNFLQLFKSVEEYEKSLDARSVQ